MGLLALTLSPGCRENSGSGVVVGPTPEAGPPVTPADQQKWFKTSYLDAGKVDEGTVVKRLFPFKNPNSRPQRIKCLNKDCACARTAVHFGGKVIEAVSPLIPPLVIPPGGEGKIEVVLDTTTIDGPKKAGVMVQTDDPAALWLRVEVKATSILHFWPDPRKAGLGEIGASDQANFKFQVFAKHVLSWGIQKIDAPDGWKFIYEKSTLGGKDSWLVRGSVGPGLAPGIHSTKLTIHTDQAGHKITFPVELAVRAAWEVDPPGSIKFGRIKRGRGKAIPLVIRVLTRKRRLKLKSLRLKECSRERGFFRLTANETRKGRRYDVTFSALKTLPSGPFKGVVLVRTDDPEMPEQEIPFHGFVR